MKTHYSILSVQIRPEIQERISIGLLLVSDRRVFFNYSRNKLKAAKNLLSVNAYSLLKDSIKNLEYASFETDTRSSKLNTQLLISDSMKRNTFSPEYINYLSRYNNNVLTFSAPKQIDVEADESVFRKLFYKFVDENEVSITGTISPTPIEAFKTKYIPRFVNHFDINEEVSSDEIPKLYAPVKLFLFGRNHQDVFAQPIEIADRRVQDIEIDLGKFSMVCLAYKEQGAVAKAFLVSKEPPKGEKEQHKIWDQVKSSSSFEYVDVSEADKIVEYAVKNHVLPVIAQKEKKAAK